MRPAQATGTRDSAAGAGGRAETFPRSRAVTAGAYYTDYAAEAARAAASVDPTALDRAAEVLQTAYTNGATVFACGNGGSAAIANHLHCDHSKGIASGTDLLPRVVSLAANVELITAIANDLAYDEVFAEQLRTHSRPGDVLVAVSSSGRSPNIVRALEWAQAHSLRTVALTGFDGGPASRLAEISVHVDARNYGIVEDAHQAVMHCLAHFIRQSGMTDDAISSGTF